MHIDRKTSRTAGFVILTLALIGAGAAATHPTAAAATLAALQSSVTCATSGGCISATNTGSGQGVTGTSKESFGVVGVSTLSSGLKGVSTSSSGILGIATSGQAGVRGSSVTNYGVPSSARRLQRRHRHLQYDQRDDRDSGRRRR